MNTNKILAESIAKEYLPKKDSKIVALKKLDARAKRPATVFAYTFGTISSLIAGTGMCFAMKVIGNGFFDFILGIVLGVVGFALCGVNYLLYKAILKRGKKKYAFEIVELARDICKEN